MKMKKTLTWMVAALMCCATTFAKDLKVLVVKVTPEVQNVEAQTKVKNQLRLTAGVKKIEADFAAKQLMVTYDADKTDAKRILSAMKKNGYEATVVSDGAVSEKTPVKVPVDGTSGASKMSNVKCQMSNVRCQMLNVKCEMSNVALRLSQNI